MKSCSRCKQIKPHSAFGICERSKDGLREACKECLRPYERGIYRKNRLVRQLQIRQYYLRHREHVLRTQKLRYQGLRDKLREERLSDIERYRRRERESKRRQYEANPEKFIARRREWDRLHPEHRRAVRAKPGNRLHSNMSRAIRAAIRTTKAGRKWESLVGYSLVDLMKHLESRFVDGMSWSNYGKWEVDHIIPRKAFAFVCAEDDGFKYCWSLGNLQPLWMSDNRRKHCKVL